MANFRFAHAETVMPLTSLLGIFDTDQTLEQLYLSQCVGRTSHSASVVQTHLSLPRSLTQACRRYELSPRLNASRPL